MFSLVCAVTFGQHCQQNTEDNQQKCVTERTKSHTIYKQHRSKYKHTKWGIFLVFCCKESAFIQTNWLGSTDFCHLHTRKLGIWWVLLLLLYGSSSPDIKHKNIFTRFLDVTWSLPLNLLQVQFIGKCSKKTTTHSTIDPTLTHFTTQPLNPFYLYSVDISHRVTCIW